MTKTLRKEMDDFMRDVRIQLAGVEGIVTEPITKERVDKLQDRLTKNIKVANIARADVLKSLLP